MSTRKLVQTDLSTFFVEGKPRMRKITDVSKMSIIQIDISDCDSDDNTEEYEFTTMGVRQLPFPLSSDEDVMGNLIPKPICIKTEPMSINKPNFSHAISSTPLGKNVNKENICGSISRFFEKDFNGNGDEQRHSEGQSSVNIVNNVLLTPAHTKLETLTMKRPLLSKKKLYEPISDDTTLSKKQKISPIDPIPHEGSSSSKTAMTLFSTPEKKSKTQIDNSPSTSKCETPTTTRCAQSISTPTTPVKTPSKSTQSILKPKTPVKTPRKSALSISKPRTPAKTTKLEKKEESELNIQRLNCMKDVLKNVCENQNFQKLLFPEDLAVLNDFKGMTLFYQYFVVKLFTHLPNWYNISKFCKKIKLTEKMNDNEISTMYEFLKKKSFIDTDYNNSEKMHDLLHTLDKSDLKQLAKTFKLNKKNEIKTSLIAQLLVICKTQSTLSMTKSTEDLMRDQVKLLMGYSLKLNKNIYNILYKGYLLYTYANSHYGDPQNYFNDMVHLKIVFPSYVVQDYTPFSNQQQFSSFFDSACLWRDFEKYEISKKVVGLKSVCEKAYTELSNISEENKVNPETPDFLRKFFPEYQYIGIINSGIKHLTSFDHKLVKTWIKYLISNYMPHHYSGYWYSQLAHIESFYEHEYACAAKTVLSALQYHQKHKCFSIVHLEDLSAKAERLKHSKKYKIPQLYHDRLSDLCIVPCDLEQFQFITIDAQTVRGNTSGATRKYIVHGEDGEKTFMSVENIALGYYQKNGYPKGIHCEGNIVNVSFILFFWDIIYEYEVDKTFISPLQTAPLDMNSQHFYLNRKQSIRRRLKDIRANWPEEKLATVLRTNWDMHAHEASLMKIDGLIDSVDFLLDMIVCIDRKLLSKIYERLVKHYRDFRSGLPDLFLWNPDLKTCKFVEVKGENDRLSLKQKLWLDYLRHNDAIIEVCHVHSIGSKRKASLQQ